MKLPSHQATLSGVPSPPGFKKNLARGMIAAAFLGLPFVIFYWLAPFYGSLTLGNDYGVFIPQAQLELQFSLEHDSFPLYSPGFAGGRTAAAVTSAQIFHPASHLSKLMPGYWDGLALEWNTFFRLIQLGIAQLAIMALLLRLRFSWSIAFILSFITVYNLRMLDLFRYGAAVENFAGYLYLFAALGFHFLRRGKLTGLSIMISTYLMICGGHPQIAYYGALGTIVSVLAIPFAFRAIDPGIEVNRDGVLRFYITSGLWGLGGVLLSSAYIVPFYFDFVADATVRVGRSYEWAVAFSDNWAGALGSFFAPMRSDVHGAFGSSPVIILAALLPLLLFAGRRVPAVVVALWVVAVLVFISSVGGATVIYYLFWEFFPLAQSFRVPGRINMILSTVLLLILAWIFRPAEQRASDRQSGLVTSRPDLMLSLVAILMFAAFNWYLSEQVPAASEFTPAEIQGGDFPAWLERTLLSIGLLTLLLVAVYQFCADKCSPGTSTSIGVVLSALIVVQVTLELRHGTWTVEKSPVWTLGEMKAQKVKSLGFAGVPGYGFESTSVTEQMRRSFLEPKLAKFYRRYLPAKDQDDAYRVMATERVADMAVIESHNGDHMLTSGKENDEIRLTYSSFNKLSFQVHATDPGYFVLGVPFLNKWEGFVDGKPAEIKRANGNLIALRLNQGNQEVTFRYFSVFAWSGMLISCLALVLAAIAISMTSRGGRFRWLPVPATLAISASLFLAWHSSLYSGNNLGTQYQWDSRQFPDVRNVSYGRPTQMSSIWSSHTPYEYHSGRAVDGDREGDGFVTGEDDARSWWEVDLGFNRAINEVVVYPAPNERLITPLDLLVSSDGRNYLFMHSFETSTQSEPYRIAFPKRLARFVRLMSGRSGPISVREVEVFSPD